MANLLPQAITLVTRSLDVFIYEKLVLSLCLLLAQTSYTSLLARLSMISLLVMLAINSSTESGFRLT